MSATSLLFRDLNRRFNVVVRSFCRSTIPCHYEMLLSRSFTSNGLKEELLSFTVSYLTKSCGLSLKQAKSASALLHLDNPERPNSVLEFLRGHGFSSTQVSKIVRERPKLLLRNAQKTLLPKVDFLRSVGTSSGDIASILSSNPTFLVLDVEKFLIPFYKFLKTELFKNERVTKTLKLQIRSYSRDMFTNGATNLALLRRLGVTEISISNLLTFSIRVVFQNTLKFSEVVQKVKAMGFDPYKWMFVVAIHSICSLTISKWDSKFKAHQGWGWSEEETLSAFKKHPCCLRLSDKKIVKMMDFFVNKMGYSSQVIAGCPSVLLYSFEKRIVPRGSVFRVLLSKRLIKQDHSLPYLMSPPEKYFLERYVTRYEESFPQLLDLYKGKLDLQDLGIKSQLYTGQCT